ncbi:hypothetical protein Tco_0984693, partial [Tanacetum coccineum]
NRGQGNNARGSGAAGYGGAQNRVGNANPGQAKQIKCYNCNVPTTSDNDSGIDFPFCDNSVTFSNSHFNSNDDFTSSDDESLPKEDVQEENFKIYSNPLFEFDDKYISSDVNTRFNQVLEDIERKNSYKQALLVTHLSELNEDECSDPGGDEIEACLTSDSIPLEIDDADFDPKGDILLL